MANSVRLTPTMSDANTPSEATAAPTRTAGASQSSEPAFTAVVRGAVDAASASGPTASNAASATVA
jgi:hypothetical protein